MKKRQNIPAQLKRQLFIECGFKCAVPRCEHEDGLEMHHINNDPSDNSRENLIVLCAVHHSMTTKGRIDSITMMKIKELLVDLPLSNSRTKYLKSRKEFFEEAIYLLKTTDTYRATMIGPTFLHPLWYYKRRDALVQIPNYDILLKKFILNKNIKKQNVRLIFRNVERYKNKIDNYVKPSERKKFIKALLENIDKIWGVNGENGPDLCCFDTGFRKVEMIFTEGCLTSFRYNPIEPIVGGKLLNYFRDIEDSKSEFDTIFDKVSEGKKLELQKLKTYVANLWKK